MDLRLYIRVLSRWRWLVVAGSCLAVLAALAVTFKVDSDGVGFRESKTYSAIEDVLLTERGFPVGRATVGGTGDPAGAADVAAAAAADSSRLIELAGVYVQLASSDPVVAIMEESGPVDGALEAVQFTADDGRSGLPLIRLTALADTGEEAVSLVRRNTKAFRQYVTARQVAADIPPAERIVLTPIRRADEAELTSGRSIVTPVIVFLAIIAVTCGAAFLAENLRPRDDDSPGPDGAPDGARDISTTGEAGQDPLLGVGASEPRR